MYDKKIIFVIIFIITLALILAGYFIPIDSYETMSCTSYQHSTRQELIFGGSLEAIKKEAQDKDRQEYCAEGGVPQTYELFVL